MYALTVLLQSNKSKIVSSSRKAIGYNKKMQVRKNHLKRGLARAGLLFSLFYRRLLIFSNKDNASHQILDLNCFFYKCMT